ncbi:MAG: hypothetical protein LBT66_08930 [Methanobrevibacter sp.]|jgi:uncharacterized protein YwgA|nr:hypothetical protein [Candidatus Methanovirga meridionalis]
MKNIEKLKKFLNILKKEIGFSFKIDDFDNRVKLQKYVFISKYFGFDHNYNYNLYLRDPYSSDLSNDYYNNSLDMKESNNSLKMNIVPFFISNYE